MSGPWVASGGSTPFHTIRSYLALGPLGAAGHLGGPLLSLAPVGFLFPLVGGRVDVNPVGSFARSAFGGLMLAFAAEMVRTGSAGQLFDVDVVLLNTAGVALAHLAVVPATRSALRRRGPVRLEHGVRPPGDPSASGPRPPVGATP